jgi:hypothetical protein
VSTVKDHARFMWRRVVGNDALKAREGKQFRLSCADLMDQEIDASTVFDHVFIERLMPLCPVARLVVAQRAGIE